MEKLKIRGDVKITHKDKYGKILSIEEGHNLIVNPGLQFMAKLLNGVSVAPFKYMAVGTDATVADPTDDALYAESVISGLARLEATCAYEASYIADLQANFVNNESGDIDLEEAGIFDTASSGGNMLCRKVFASTKTLGSGEAVTIDWKITFSL